MYGRVAVPTLVLVVVVAIGAASATEYVAGVIVGERLIYGQYRIAWNTTGSPFSSFQNVSSATLLITNVSSPIVTANETINFTSGSPLSSILRGDLSAGNGNLGLFVIAAGLNAGDRISTQVSALTINATVNRSYLGISRAVNVYNATVDTFSGSAHQLLFWDQMTGILLEAGFNESRVYPSPGHGYVHYILTSARGWPPSASSTIFGLPPLIFYSVLAAIAIIPALTAVVIRRRKKQLEPQTPLEASSSLSQQAFPFRNRGIAGSWSDLAQTN